MVTLETPRLLLRPITLDDLHAKYLIGQHPDFYAFDGFERLVNGQKRPRTLEETRAKLEQRIGEFALQGFGQWAAVLKENNTLIGWAACNSICSITVLIAHQKSNSFTVWRESIGARA